jgi:hypothetical protein
MRRAVEVKYDDKIYSFDMDDITVQQLKTLFSHMGGMTLASLEQGLQVGDPNSLTAIFWLMMENSGNSMPLDRVDFKVVRFFRALNDAAVAEKQKRDAEAARGEDPKAEGIEASASETPQPST